ncbi:Delta(24)-sterol reductase [Aspergillus hancockii]|nr:Delta(24)-sterol reductase [Aspergillus hancockii]
MLETRLISAKPYVRLTYDRGGFWNHFTRWLLDGSARTYALYHAVHKSGLFKQYTTLDAAVLYPGASKLVDFLDERFKRYPLWLCPLRQTRAPDASLIHGLTTQRYDPVHPLNEPEMMLSFGVWGPSPGNHQRFVQFNRDLDQVIWR